MGKCKYLSGCAFFADQMGHMPATTRVYQRNYCTGDFKRCARFRVAERLSSGQVPDDLFPNEHERAARLIGVDKDASDDIESAVSGVC